MNDSIKMIRFIDSNYRELFQIPDGASIRVIYPPEDGRENVSQECVFISDCHAKIGGTVFHLCQFAEAMERIGAHYEPAIQLQGIEVVPFTPGEERFLTYNREEGNTCIGHVAGDFGRSGDRFHSRWYSHKNRTADDWSDTTPEFRAELNSVIYALRQKLLKDQNTMQSFCQTQPDAKIPGREELEHYGFKLETAERQYFILCVAERESWFVVYAYDNTAGRQV